LNKKLTIAFLTVGLIASVSASNHTSDSFFGDSFFDDEWENNFYGETEAESFFGDSWDSDFFGDDTSEEQPMENESENQTDYDQPGCQEGEVRIPEDQNCDGEIDEEFQSNNTDDSTDENSTDEDTSETIEERQVTPAPEPDGVGEDWISYPNPRDHILSYDTISDQGDIKVCKVLLNQNNEVITGENVEGAEFSVDTNISEGEPEYTDSDPIRFEAPLNQVADLIGTSPDYREGDGMLDAECAEYHNLPFGTYTYSNETISGPNSENVELVGVTEYWDGRPTGNPFTKEVYDYGENNLSDGKLVITPDEENNHAEVIFVNRIKG